MKKCIAFVPQGRSRNAWRPCRDATTPNSLFCQRHETVFAGVMLGICINSYPGEMEELRKSILENMPVASRKPS